jgi:hypothetical protein
MHEDHEKTFLYILTSRFDQIHCWTTDLNKRGEMSFNIYTIEIQQQRVVSSVKKNDYFNNNFPITALVNNIDKWLIISCVSIEMLVPLLECWYKIMKNNPRKPLS